MNWICFTTGANARQASQAGSRNSTMVTGALRGPSTGECSRTSRAASSGLRRPSSEELPAEDAGGTAGAGAGVSVTGAAPGGASVWREQPASASPTINSKIFFMVLPGATHAD
jgi:hypothetical protein